MSKGLGLSTNYWAKCCAILENMEMVVIRDWKQVWVETDSKVMLAFVSNKVPWQLRKRWELCKRKLDLCLISHTWKEANFAADIAAKHGTSLIMGTMEVYVGRPPWLYKLKNPDYVYFRFC
ncbi:hypothetical protein IFM89_035218 [Coptis chinensis]|uniref:RNase H type-1 domain-containing protein n=1 Tax=Coptis chinensis TaxID=261450 RepID=A0A835M843_9MAGN|nr:hypothetical protein IFM89_035218 [Coptis chinensis]